MDMKEHIKPIQTEDKKSRGKWKDSHVVFLVLPILCILLVPFMSISYSLCGRLSRHILLVYMCYTALVIFMIFCFFASIARLIDAWKKCTWAKRTLIITEICLPLVCVVLLMMLLPLLVESQLRPDAGGLYGLRDRVRSQADIPAIRNWLKTLDNEDYTPRSDYLSADKLPEPLKWMSFGSVHLSEDKNGNPYVVISAGVFDHWGANHWGATIGLEDMVISESDLESRYECWLLVEPGVYVYEW